MSAIFSVATVCCVLLLSSVQAFSPTNVVSRSSVRGSTIVMDGKTRDLRDRIKSIKNTRRITEAMRLVAAARVRRAQEAVLKTRPLISQLQLVSLNSISWEIFVVILVFVHALNPSSLNCCAGIQDCSRGLQVRGS
jgi:ATP synthase